MLSVPATAGDIAAAIRRREFARLDRANHAYLDYAGSALYASSQVEAHRTALLAGIFGNPHSDHEPSRASTDILEHVRDLILGFFGVTSDTHVVCFTANATAAVKLVAESYPFDRGTACVLSADNHNSVNGVREFARRAGAPVHYLPVDRSLLLDGPRRRLETCATKNGGLLAFPAQSNFSGVRHPLDLVDVAHDLRYDVLLDAAALVASRSLNLHTCSADFTALSLYKLFGYPTGLGALVARRRALGRLDRPWFAGGAVLFASVQAATHQLRPDAHGYEDGTPDFLGVAAVPAGFTLLEDVGMSVIESHVRELTRLLLHRLLELRHRNGAPAVTIYGPTTTVDRGGIVAFNLLDRHGRVRPYREFETRASAAGVSVRGGCFCNPGAAEAAFGFDRRRASRCLGALGPGFSIERFAGCMGGGTPVGAVRASVGLANNAADVERCAAVAATFRE